jgi:Phosphopantetheine attachment site
VAVEALPLTPNGKLDRRALPAPGRAPRPGSVGAPPRTALERAVAAIWQEVLGAEWVGLYDNFFDLGGHSLLLVQANARIRAVTGQDVPLIEMFNHPTVHALAAYLAQEKAREDGLGADEEQLRRLQQGRQRMRQQLEQRRRLPRSG